MSFVYDDGGRSKYFKGNTFSLESDTVDVFSKDVNFLILYKTEDDEVSQVDKITF